MCDKNNQLNNLQNRVNKIYINYYQKRYVYEINVEINEILE